MQVIVFISILFLVCVNNSQALKCYQCFLSEKCETPKESNLPLLPCEISETLCSTIEVRLESDKTGIIRKCESGSTCLETKKDFFVKKCNICEGDGCNGAYHKFQNVYYLVTLLSSVVVIKFICNLI
ncbi:unnamed protein product [Brassicogethes aeneus]|uniref:Protein quiver n=1 Tax=Brassicogethes aeneus TaxID=1431903 RepID=A0A9P0FS42_BRAAE|nr:unnamed protein product [Brassicogethes aeneus]